MQVFLFALKQETFRYTELYLSDNALQIEN